MSQVNEYISIESQGTDRWLQCRCGKRLCDANANPKDHVKSKELPIQAAGPHVAIGERELSKSFVWREFYCPDCGLMLNTEVALKDDPYLHDALIF
jgi:acetone carboxylase gamma subunit